LLITQKQNECHPPFQLKVQSNPANDMHQ